MTPLVNALFVTSESIQDMMKDSIPGSLETVTYLSPHRCQLHFNDTAQAGTTEGSIAEVFIRTTLGLASNQVHKVWINSYIPNVTIYTSALFRIVEGLKARFKLIYDSETILGMGSADE